MPETAPALGRREATLRAAATICLAGIALIQAIQLPFTFVSGHQYGLLSLIGMAGCLALGLALAAGPATASRPLWGVVAGAAVLIFASWLVPRLVTIPGLAFQLDQWRLTAGAVCAGLALACLVVAVVAAPPTRASLRPLATALAVLVAFAPGIGVALVALGPGLSGGEGVLASGVHVHVHHGVNVDATIRFEALPGGKGGHFVYTTPPPPHQSALGIALIIAAGFIFTYGAVMYLRRRSASAERDIRLHIEEGLA